MKKVLYLIILIVIISAKLFPQSVNELIKQSDEFTEIKFNNQESIKVLEIALSKEPKNFDVLWRLSRAYVDYAEHLPSKTDDEQDIQLREYEKSLDFADKAIEVNGGSMLGYLRKAIVNGKIALFKGVFTSIGLVKQVKQDVEKAILLKNGGDNNLGVAYYVLGRTHSKVAEKSYLLRIPLGLTWGDRDIAKENFEKAIKLRPDFIMFRLDAAKNYIELEDYQKAKEHLLALRNMPKLDEDDEVLRIEAKNLYETIKNE